MLETQKCLKNLLAIVVIGNVVIAFMHVEGCRNAGIGLLVVEGGW